jgi:hypothetical protein
VCRRGEEVTMGKYGEVALRATALLRERACEGPPEAWAVAARTVFPTSIDSQRKPCPKGAYLGLCEEGLVVGVPKGNYTRSRDNKAYAVEAVRLLMRNPALADRTARDGGAANLWRLVMKGVAKRPNSQMEVVLALWNQRLIVRAPAGVASA